MRLTEIVIVYGLLIFFAGSLFDGIIITKRISDKGNEIRTAYENKKFIAESFKATCRDSGFSSLNEWQTTCRAMFNLDYIGWSNAGDFMEVDYKNSENNLYYGKWNSQFCDGEVYCRGLQ